MMRQPAANDIQRRNRNERRTPNPALRVDYDIPTFIRRGIRIPELQWLHTRVRQN